ncbi:MAG: helix-turn-helix transcriptional regulator, partial [Firmicutes bacterium]|nr:helix-turn-helix transcriptional regulator [Bacillota bacterium]
MHEPSLYSNRLNNCPLTYALNIVGGKWRLPIIWAISQNEPIRYNELKRNVDRITNMMLTQSLRELEAQGVIS